MKPDEQSATPFDPLDGFMIPGSWTRRVPTRPPGLEEFLAPSPVPNEPRSTDETEEPRAKAVASPLVASDESQKLIYQHAEIREDWGALAAIVADRPLVDEAASEIPPAPRTIADEAAALAADEPRALVAPADVFIEPMNRVPRFDDRREEGGEAFRALFDGEALVDSSPWFASGREPGSSGESIVAPSFGSQSSASSVSSPLGWRASDESRESGPSLFPGADRLDGPTSESFEEIEARFSRIAEKLEEAVDRIGSTASEPLSARGGGFRGRVDE